MPSAFVLIVVAIFIIYILSSIKILPEYERGVIFRLGRLLPEAKGPGIFTPAVRGGTYVSAGARLGTMSDYYGRRTADIVAPLSGLVTFIRGVPSTWKDATLANVAPILQNK